MEWLANISVKWVLIAVAVLLVLRWTLWASRKVRVSLGAVRELVDAALMAIVIVFLIIRPFLFQAYFIPSESMYPTLTESDRILVSKFAYRFREPERGEVVVFRPPAERVPEVKDYVKRVIGLPGELVEVVPKRLLVDGHTLMRFTRESASEVMSQNYAFNETIGFTYPLEGGSVRMEDDGAARVATGHERGFRIAVYQPSDEIRVTDQEVLKNGSSLLSVVLGRIQVEPHNPADWGGEIDLDARLFKVEGRPRLLLVRGRELSLDPGHVLIDGRRLREPYVAEYPEYAMPPLRIPPGHYFVLGDNRNYSFDSHAWGPLGRDGIVGRAELIFWPPSRLRLLTHVPPLLNGAGTEVQDDEP